MLVSLSAPTLSSSSSSSSPSLLRERMWAAPDIIPHSPTACLWLNLLLMAPEFKPPRPRVSHPLSSYIGCHNWRMTPFLMLLPWLWFIYQFSFRPKTMCSLICSSILSFDCLGLIIIFIFIIGSSILEVSWDLWVLQWFFCTVGFSIWRNFWYQLWKNHDIFSVWFLIEQWRRTRIKILKSTVETNCKRN